MSQEKHSSSAIMYAVIGVSILLMVAIVPFSMKGKGGMPAASGDAAELRIQPVARIAFAATGADAKSAGPRDGATVYNSVCMACHASGAAGAPKTGDKASWAPRLGQGLEGLTASAIKGKGAMPPRGGKADLSDDEVKAAVEHLIASVK